MRNIRVGTRNSQLAVIQTKQVIRQLKQAGMNDPVTIKKIATTGDRHLNVSLPKLGGGVFFQELEQALLAEDIDFAVHSLKDITEPPPDDLVIAAIPEREDCRDAYVANDHTPFDELPEGAIIGTSSLRRSAQLLAKRPDLETKWIRGPVDSRIEQMQRGDYDAIVLAVAGLRRLGIAQDVITEYLPADTFVPALGQGALAIECRKNDRDIRDMLRLIHDPLTAKAVRAERLFLQSFQAHDQAPIAGVAQVDEHGDIVLNGAVIAYDGQTILQTTKRGASEEHIAKEAAEALIAEGAMDIIEAAERELHK
ncbi:MAG TPA: hydroxymethylbilane synthase [Bacillota bacterium]|nr:hydroxymethylbilane synthase [Bacillota bacterium]